MEIPGNLKYAKTHEWVRVAGQLAYVGITDYAQEALGDIVYVELPSVDERYDRGEEIGTVESVKAASAIYTPVTGIVAEVNAELEASPELINQKPYQAFIFAVRFTDLSQLQDLLDAEAYARHVEQEKGSH
jgi:glycine cleavage system H protein